MDIKRQNSNAIEVNKIFALANIAHGGDHLPAAAVK